MSTKYTGGFITKSPVAPTTTAASGIWTLDQQQQAQKAGTWPSPPVFIEDLFSTYLYTGNGSTQTITNGIDLAGKGGLVWIKGRSGASSHCLQDTARGANNYLLSNATDAQANLSGLNFAFNSNGFSLNNNYTFTNDPALTYASWTFAEQPKFFDIVTFVASGSTNQRVSHNLGSVPGCIIIKNISRTEQWNVYHTSLGINYNLALNTTGAAVNVANVWGSSSPTSTDFGVNGAQLVTSGDTYVAYLYAHDAGGFPASGSGSNNAISCGSWTENGSSQINVNLGYEPQWLMIKRTDGTSNWDIVDTMRGLSVTDGRYLRANTTGAETAWGAPYIVPTATGFASNFYTVSQLGTFIYIAIRRGPMKVPTDATKVFNPYSYSGDGTNSKTLPSVGFVPDWSILTKTNSGSSRYVADRLRGGSRQLDTAGTGAEFFSSQYGVQVFGQNAVTLGSNDGTDGFNQLGNTFINYSFLRAPSFFDEVCYTGTGVARTVTHNLSVTPEMMIVKCRSVETNWGIYTTQTSATSVIPFTTQGASVNSNIWNNTAPTSSVFTVGTAGTTNTSGATYVAYLFATCAGVSKVGSYTGTGALQTVNCGFTTGARFVLIKRTDSTGDWWTYDSARGITSGNDPYLFLNSTAAEVTGTNYVDTDTTGFQVTAAAPAGLNANGGTYIFLAIA